MCAVFTLALTALLCAVLEGAGAAKDQNRLGLSCAKVLAMKPEEWADYYESKNPGGEAGTDQAYEAYAGCMKERTDAVMTRLPRPIAARLRKYRALCGKFRVDNLELQSAYAGGGTIYGHAEPRGLVDDERLIERLTLLFSRRPAATGGAAPESLLARIRRRIAAQNPAAPANRKRLAEFSASGDAGTSYKEINHDLAALTPLLTGERKDARLLILKFLDAWSRPYGP